MGCGCCEYTLTQSVHQLLFKSFVPEGAYLNINARSTVWGFTATHDFFNAGFSRACNNRCSESGCFCGCYKCPMFGSAGDQYSCNFYRKCFCICVFYFDTIYFHYVSLRVTDFTDDYIYSSKLFDKMML